MAEELTPEQRLRAALTRSHQVDNEAKAAVTEELNARASKPVEKKPVVDATQTNADNVVDATDAAAAHEAVAETEASDTTQNGGENQTEGSEAATAENSSTETATTEQ